MHRFFLAAALLVTAGCDEEVASEPSSEACDDEPAGDDGSGTPTALTLGVYELVDGCYVDQGIDLTFAFGVACDSWSRTTKKPDDFSDESHLHYNAADDMTYDQVTFTWTEYGPEHSQQDIDELCASGAGGTSKEASWTGYVEEPPGSGAWLRIKEVTY